MKALEYKAGLNVYTLLCMCSLVMSLPHYILNNSSRLKFISYIAPSLMVFV